MLDAEFVAVVDKMRENLLSCFRPAGGWHEWQRDKMSRWYTVNGYTVAMTCASCGMERRRIMEGGRAVGNQYIRPEGYGLTGFGGLDEEQLAYLAKAWASLIPIVEPPR